MKRVMISLDDRLLEKARAHARGEGKSFDELVSDLLGRAVEDRSAALQETWGYADQLSLRLNAPMPRREERGSRRNQHELYAEERPMESII